MSYHYASRFSRPALTLLLALGLAGCSLGTIDYRQINSGYDAFQYRWIPYTSSMAADVSGNPFPIPQSDFNRQISEAIQAPGYIPSSAGPRVRMVFNGAPATGNAAASGDYICASSGDTGTAVGRSAGSRITLAAAYCSGGSALTFATGAIDNVTGPDDPDFRSYVRNMAVYLFPSPESSNDPNSCFSNFGC